MNAIRNQLAIHADRAARYQAEAREARLAAEIRRARRADQAGERRIRGAIGRSIVRLGARIAADPAVERCVVAAHGGRSSPATLDGALRT